jgi:glyceraldehyde 3-phosphate dehydrogenase
MAIRVGINGFGRIGRSVFRILSDRDDIEVIAVNDIYDNDQLAYLLKYDTVMGKFDRSVSVDDEAMYVGDDKVLMTAERDPALIAWGEMGIDVVVEATGVFRFREQLEKHLVGGAAKVVLTVPPKDEIEEGVITTVHAYTNGQRLADVPHKSIRRSRAAAENVIPTSTGAARAVGKVLPHLNGKLDGIAIRVPVPDGSIVDLVCRLGKGATRDEVNRAVRVAAEGPMRSVVEYSEEALVSSDIIGNPHSSIFDALSTASDGEGHVRVVSWYDNEWGYSNRVVDLIDRLAELGG